MFVCMPKVKQYHPNRSVVFLLLSSILKNGHATPEHLPQFLDVNGCGSLADNFDGVYKSDLDSEDVLYEGLAGWFYLSKAPNGRWELADWFSEGPPLMRTNDLAGPWEKWNEDGNTYSLGSDLCRVHAVCRIAKALHHWFGNFSPMLFFFS